MLIITHGIGFVQNRRLLAGLVAIIDCRRVEQGMTPGSPGRFIKCRKPLLQINQEESSRREKIIPEFYAALFRNSNCHGLNPNHPGI
jgi:hypothetical protein